MNYLVPVMQFRFFNAPMKAFPLLILFALLRYEGAAQYVFEFTPGCQQAYRSIIQLKQYAGKQVINEEKARNPNNVIPHFLEDYIDFFILFFNEDPEEYKKRNGNFSRRLELMNKGPKNSPFYLFTKSVIHFHSASIDIKFGNNWEAGWAFRRSFLQSKENHRNFPDFSPAQLYSGAMEVAAGTIPDGYKWLSGLLGIQGNIKTGMKRLEAFLQRSDQYATIFHDEAVFYYLYLKFYIENDKDGVFKYIQSNNLDVVNNHLFAYLATNLSINNQQSVRAQKILKERNQSPEYFSTPIWDLETGYLKLNHLQPDAGVYFERFLRSFKGRFYVKDALQKLSWHYYLQNDQAKAEQYRKLIPKHGTLNTEADMQAHKDALAVKWPNTSLLKVRLLIEGGHFREALRLLHGKSANDFSTPEEKLEFSYRVGRLYDDVGNDEESIAYYKQAILLGEKRKEYYAARSALHIGYIYEKRGDKENAKLWFRRCLSMKDHDYKNSLDQRAKAGLARLEN